jgi:hypothetical protein
VASVESIRSGVLSLGEDGNARIEEKASKTNVKETT